MQPQILDVANYVRDEDGKVPNLAQLGSCCLQCLALPLAAWRPEVLKDGAAVPAPGAGDALVLQISCNEVQTNSSSRTRTKDEKGDERRSHWWTQ